MAKDIVALRRVLVYRTPDGKDHPNRMAAKKHQARVLLAEWLVSATGVSEDDARDGAEQAANDAQKLTKLLRDASKGES